MASRSMLLKTRKQRKKKKTRIELCWSSNNISETQLGSPGSLSLYHQSQEGGLGNNGTLDRQLIGKLLAQDSTQREKFLLSCILSRDTKKYNAGKLRIVLMTCLLKLKSR